jgi:hypothetical protein
MGPSEAAVEYRPPIPAGSHGPSTGGGPMHRPRRIATSPLARRATASAFADVANAMRRDPAALCARTGRGPARAGGMRAGQVWRHWRDVRCWHTPARPARPQGVEAGQVRYGEPSAMSGAGPEPTGSGRSERAAGADPTDVRFRGAGETAAYGAPRPGRAGGEGREAGLCPAIGAGLHLRCRLGNGMAAWSKFEFGWSRQCLPDLSASSDRGEQVRRPPASNWERC